MSKVVVIGSGFSGISAAAYLSQGGHEVHVFEKNPTAGGRARQLITDNGYTFDRGPSWYWMPGVFENFFSDFGYSVKDFYELKLLNPSFDIVFGQNDVMSIPSDLEELCNLFETIENGSGEKLKAFLEEARYKYVTGMENLIHKPGLSIKEFADTELIKGVFRLQVFSSFSKHVRKFFSHPKLIALMEFPVLFLGASPQDTPALYSLMNYAGLKLGTWYPAGGFGKVIDAMVQVAQKNGACFHFNSPVEHIRIKNKKATEIIVNGNRISCDGVIASADYHHVENKLLPVEYTNYSNTYWEKKTFAPSCLIFYLGINKRINALHHHTLFFEKDLYQHTTEIYKSPQWPSNPLFYVCCTSKSDNQVAPQGHENLFLLMPLAAGLNDSHELREKYFTIMMERLQMHVNENIDQHIDFKESYCINDFINDYNSFKGNAYGLANTLMQTAILKPKIKNKNISNLYYAGQLTVPGPGVPPSIISGKISATELNNYLKKVSHEITI